MQPYLAFSNLTAFDENFPSSPKQAENFLFFHCSSAWFSFRPEYSPFCYASCTEWWLEIPFLRRSTLIWWGRWRRRLLASKHNRPDLSAWARDSFLGFESFLFFSVTQKLHSNIWKWNWLTRCASHEWKFGLVSSCLSKFRFSSYCELLTIGSLVFQSKLSVNRNRTTVKLQPAR